MRNYSKENRYNMPFFNQQTTFEVIFDNNPERVFYAGQKISGRVRLTLHKEHTLHGIFIKIEGKAYCYWIVGFGDVVTRYTGEEIYIDAKKYVAGNNIGETVFPPAEYTYRFEWNLPAELPVSFEGKHGYIRYNIVAGLDRLSQQEKCFVEPFIVWKRLDLNEMPDLKSPIELVEVAEFLRICNIFYCLERTPILIKGRLVGSGYVPSETISLDLRLQNDSDIPIKSITWKFVQIITYHSNKGMLYHTKVEKVTLLEKVCKGCTSHSIVDQHIDAYVPAGLLPTETTSNVCMLEYAIVLTGPGELVDPLLTIPIVVGTVPLNKTYPSLAVGQGSNSNQPDEYSTTVSDAIQSY